MSPPGSEESHISPTFAPMPENTSRQIFTENIDYLKTGPDSIWKGQNPKTYQAAVNFFGSIHRHIDLSKQYFDTHKAPGFIVDLGGGDGRYANLLLVDADRVIELDIDGSALQKVKRDHPWDWEKEHLHAVQANLVDRFPFADASIGGMFSAGILHLFKPETFQNIASEIDRVLKPSGGMLLEFRINIKRTKIDSKTKHDTKEALVFGEEKLYKRKGAEAMIRKAFPGFNLEFEVGDKVNEKFEEANPPYKFSCTNLLVMGIKK